MKRIATFRGLRADGTWLYGDLIHNRGHVYIADDNIVDSNDIQGHTAFEVNPTTIGQYIGRESDTDTALYTGDIIEFFVKGRPMFGIIEYSADIAGHYVRLTLNGVETEIFCPIPKHCNIIGYKHQIDK